MRELPTGNTEGSGLRTPRDEPVVHFGGEKIDLDEMRGVTPSPPFAGKRGRGIWRETRGLGLRLGLTQGGDKRNARLGEGSAEATERDPLKVDPQTPSGELGIRAGTSERDGRRGSVIETRRAARALGGVGRELFLGGKQSVEMTSKLTP